MKYSARVLALLLCLPAVFGLVGCARDTVAPVISGVGSSDITASGATITWTTDEKATSQVDYGTAAGYDSWSDPDNSVGTSHSVSLSGLTANATYHYRVRSADGSGNEAVSEDLTFATPQPVAGVTLNKSATAIVKGLSEQLAVTIQPPNATNQAVAWSSTDNSVAMVDTGGLVTGVNTGTAVITATTADQGLTASCTVTVTPDGQLPVLRAGSEWHYQVAGSDRTLVCFVLDEDEVNGQDCWTFMRGLVPADSASRRVVISRVSKATFFDLEEAYGGFDEWWGQSTWVVYSYAPPDASLFPLAAGKQLSVAVTTTTTTAEFTGLVTDNETVTVVHTYRIEAVEEVTVPAGTFRCFKIRDTTSAGVETRWYSDRVRFWVKTVDAAGTTTELTSYSL